MCLIAFRYDENSDYPLVYIENRDEEYNRPSQSIHFWKNDPSLLAGKDLKKGGTWLGITNTRKIATLLNHPFTEFELDPDKEPLSRGNLVKRFLTEENSTKEFLNELKETRRLYDGYHLLFGTLGNMHLYSNVLDRDVKFDEGLYSISNTQDDLSRFRLTRSKQLLKSYLDSNASPKVDELTELFKDSKTNENISNFPDRITKEQAIQSTAMFIKGEVFGSVGTTAILVDRNGFVQVKEVRYDNKQQVVDDTFRFFYFER